MEHAEFVDACKNGTRKIYVNRSKALQAVTEGILPKRYQYAHIFWSWVWGLSIVGFIIGAFFTMGISLLGLLFVSPMLSKCIKKSAFDFVIEHAAENPEFYTFAIANGIITIE